MRCYAGTDFPYQQFYPKTQKSFRWIDSETRLDVALQSSGADRQCEGHAGGLDSADREQDDRSYLDLCLGHYKDARKSLDDLAVGEPGRTPIHPQYVAKILDELATEMQCLPATWYAYGLGRALSPYERQAPAAWFV